jgi:diacylglycerol kinase family enzyme
MGLGGLLTTGKMTPYEGRLVSPPESAGGSFIALAVGNARQAGGGFQVTPKAYLNDGLVAEPRIRDRGAGRVADQSRRGTLSVGSYGVGG